MNPMDNAEKSSRTSNVDRGYQVCGVLGRRNKPCQRVGLCPFHGTKGSLTLKNGFNICTEDNQVQYFDLPVSAASFMMEQMKQKRRKLSEEEEEEESTSDRSAPSSPLPSSLPSSPSLPSPMPALSSFPPAAVLPKPSLATSTSKPKNPFIDSPTTTTEPKGLPSISSLLNAPMNQTNPPMYQSRNGYPTGWSSIPPLVLSVPVYPQQWQIRNPYLISNGNLYTVHSNPEFNSSLYQIQYASNPAMNPLKRSFSNIDISSSFPSVIQSVK
eukprot:TRINITY_DN12620_c0_g1_i1.p1 TRINITY_DN12620_c0_g1~~TRINITY_DN12620_c0_g1_i1.p1  ORF type:complete len:270 (-),score=77.95 TRINITY_DN12620_c0_g1_i1:101-910(-)